MYKFKLLLAIVLMIFFGVKIALALTVGEVAGELLSPDCGSNMSLSACQMQSAQEAKDIIKQKIDKGESKKQIINYFVAQYGEKVLAVPTKKGFNLTAWVTPFIGIFTGCYIVIIFVLRWSRYKIKPKNARDESLTEAEKEKYSQRIEEELKKLE